MENSNMAWTGIHVLFETVRSRAGGPVGLAALVWINRAEPIDRSITETKVTDRKALTDRHKF